MHWYVITYKNSRIKSIMNYVQTKIIKNKNASLNLYI